MHKEHSSFAFFLFYILLILYFCHEELPIVILYWESFSMIDTPLCTHPKCLDEPFLHFTIFQIFGVFLSLIPTLTQSLGCESKLGSQHIA
jgi:hypothetical protein